MYGKVYGACLTGIDGRVIEVEADVGSGLPQVQLVGLPDSSVRESVERVRSAIRNSGSTFPLGRVTINLAPADVRKDGTSFDLAIAAAVLHTTGQLDPSWVKDTVFIGELALDGTLRAVPGVISMAYTAKKLGYSTLVIPEESVREAALVPDIKLIPLNKLSELKELPCFVNGFNHSHDEICRLRTNVDLDFADVRGHRTAKRALVIAAAGRHNLLFSGTPGSGKTMLMKRLPTIMPLLSDEEGFEVTRIYSAAGQLPKTDGFIRERPFRSPHHTISTNGLAGGGSVPKPGEVSLAHYGVLYLDELPEFSRASLEVLRQPLEDRSITIGRARGVTTFPASFLFAASMNPCPCGYYGSGRSCTCSVQELRRYRAKLSGPLIDRIDLQVEVPKPVDFWEETEEGGTCRTGTTEGMRKQVEHAQAVQAERYRGTVYRYNSELQGSSLRIHCALTKDAEKLLRSAFDNLGLSARAHDRILKVARTIADVDGAAQLEGQHLAEAIQYRFWDRQHQF